MSGGLNEFHRAFSLLQMISQLAMISNLFSGDGIIILLILLILFVPFATAIFLLFFFMRRKSRKEGPPPLPKG